MFLAETILQYLECKAFLGQPTSQCSLTDAELSGDFRSVFNLLKVLFQKMSRGFYDLDAPLEVTFERIDRTQGLNMTWAVCSLQGLCRPGRAKNKRITRLVECDLTSEHLSIGSRIGRVRIANLDALNPELFANQVSRNLKKTCKRFLDKKTVEIRLVSLISGNDSHFLSIQYHFVINKTSGVALQRQPERDGLSNGRRCY
ncbi:hypothetical protein BN949_05311 [Agrobacterium tumefaciens]|nr:hypothetical protein BN949_05311 [Agrobacterium tumefaciens]